MQRKADNTEAGSDLMFYLLNKTAMEVYISTPDALPVLVQLEGAEQGILDRLHDPLDAFGPHQTPDEEALRVGHYPSRGRPLRTPHPTDVKLCLDMSIQSSEKTLMCQISLC